MKLRLVIFSRASGDARFHFNNLIEFITGEEPGLETLSRTSYLPLKQEFCTCRTRAARIRVIERFGARTGNNKVSSPVFIDYQSAARTLPLPLRKRTTLYKEASIDRNRRTWPIMHHPWLQRLFDASFKATGSISDQINSSSKYRRKNAGRRIK